MWDILSFFDNLNYYESDEQHWNDMTKFLEAYIEARVPDNMKLTYHSNLKTGGKEICGRDRNTLERLKHMIQIFILIHYGTKCVTILHISISSVLYFFQRLVSTTNIQWEYVVYSMI